jgi:hypothetical protein
VSIKVGVWDNAREEASAPTVQGSTKSHVGGEGEQRQGMAKTGSTSEPMGAV